MEITVYMCKEIVTEKSSEDFNCAPANYYTLDQLGAHFVHSLKFMIQCSEI